MGNTELQLANTKLVQQRENWLIQNTLDAGQQKLVKFFNHPTVKEVDDTTLKQIIDTAISVAAQDLGKLLEDDDVLYMVNEIFIFLRDKFQSMRVVEVKIAFQCGVAKEYGDFYGFNTATLKGFIKSYMNDLDRSEAIKRFMAIKHQAEVKAEPTDEQKEALGKEIVINAFDKFKTTGWYDDFNNVVFATILKRNPSVFDFTDEQIIGFYKTAKQRLLKHYAGDKSITLFEARNIKSRINELLRINNFSKAVKDAEIVSEANRVALNFIFRELLLAGKEVEVFFGNVAGV